MHLARSLVAPVIALLPCLCAATVYWDTSPGIKGPGYELIAGQGTDYLQYRFFLPYLYKDAGGADVSAAYPIFPGGLAGTPSLVFTLASDAPAADANMAFDIQVWGFYQGDAVVHGSGGEADVNAAATVLWDREGEVTDFSGDLAKPLPHQVAADTSDPAHFKVDLPVARHHSDLGTGYFRVGDQVTLTPLLTGSVTGSSAFGTLDLGGANAWNGLYLSIEAVPVGPLPVPEPGTALLALGGLAALAALRRLAR